MEDEALRDALGEIKRLRQDAVDLKSSVQQYADITRKGLVSATYRGIVVVFLGIFLAIFFLGLAAQSWTCDAQNLSKQRGSGHYKICAVFFPQTVPQVSNLIKAADAAKAQEQARQEVIDERKRTNDLLATFPNKIACILKIEPPDRTDKNVQACIGG